VYTSLIRLYIETWQERQNKAFPGANNDTLLGSDGSEFISAVQQILKNTNAYHYSEVIQLLEDYAASSPTAPGGWGWAHYALACIYRSRGDYKHALQVWEKYV
jgi:hypothetical protein